MADQLQLRGGTTAEHSTFTGALREVTVDTDKDTVVVHDGSTAGGHPLAKQNLSNVPAGTITSTMIADGTIVNADINASAAIAGTKISPDFGSQTIQTTGVVSHALGTAAAPTLTFTGDTNTGIYSPGADQVAISTGGSGRLFVDSTGRVGIGTSSISTISERVLHIYAGAGASSGLRLTGNAGTGLDLIHGTDGSGYLYQRDNAFLAIGTNNTERLRITSAGLVGVGVSSPSELLHLGSGGKIRLNRADNATGSTISDGGSNNGIIFNSLNNDGFTFQNAGTTVFKIDTSTNGNRVGIGTSSPLLPLHVEATTDGPQTLAYLVNASTGGTNETAALAFGLKGTAGTGICRINAGKESDHSSSANTDTFLSFATTLNDTEGERLRITSAGNVGIGTTTPQGKLSISNSGAAGIEFNAYSTYTELVSYNRSTSAYIPFSSFASVHTWNDGVGERARIDSSGRLLVGTSSATASSFLHVQGRSGATTDYAGFHLRRGSLPSGAGQILGLINFTDNSENQGAWIYAESDNGSWTSGSNHRSRLVFSTTADGASSPTERMRITNSGSVFIGTQTALGDEIHCIAGQQSNGGAGVVLIRNTLSSGSDSSPPLVLSKASTTTTSSARFVQFYAADNATPMGGIVGNGASNVQFASLSDIRDKENIKPLSESLEKVKSLEVVSYDWKNTGEHVKAGFIAQNVERVFPEYVVNNMTAEGQEPRKGITGGLSSGYVAVLTAALQEAVAKIETLEAKVAALESA